MIRKGRVQNPSLPHTLSVKSYFFWFTMICGAQVQYALQVLAFPGYIGRLRR